MMRFYSETLALSSGTFSLLSGIIHERLGLFYEDEKREILADKVSPLVLEAGFDTFLDYYYLLKYDAAAGLHWERLMDALSVQETYFWREMDQINALVNHILPAYALEKPLEPLRIWSAACATGEEPLTISMALQEAHMLDRFPIKINASDASGKALQKASTGIYRDRSFRNLSDPLKNRYFSKAPSGHCISESIGNKVQFHKANLLSVDEIAFLAKSHFIFCRNVFIYFSQESMKKVVDVFYEHMPTPGYLFVGASESLLRLGTPFELEEIGGAFVYVKRW